MIALAEWPEIMGDFPVTKDWLASRRACKLGLDWFDNNFPSPQGVSARTLLRALDNNDWRRWLLAAAWRYWLQQGPLPAGLTTTGKLDLEGYDYPLPAGLTTNSP